MSIEFLYPLGFAAAAGILAPVLLHLWRREQWKILRVGSVRLFSAAKTPRINRIRINNWPLLLLRCLLVLLLMLLLADPYMDLSQPKASEKGWVLLGRGYQDGLDSTQRSRMDSLLRGGYAVRAFEPGFRPIEPGAGDTVSAANPFRLIRNLNETVPPEFPAVIFSSARLADLSGDIPATSADLTWHTFANQPGTVSARWVSRAWTNDEGGVTLLIADATPSETRFAPMHLRGDGEAQGIQLRSEQGHLSVKAADQHDWVRVDSKKTRVQLASDPSSPDATYVRAVLQAFKKATGLPVELSAYQPGTACDLLFDLTAAGISDTSAARTAFRYMQGKAVPQTGNRLFHAHTRSDQDPVHLYQLIEGKDEGIPVWVDSFDRPVLTVSRESGRTLLRCYTRFRPQWTDLMGSEAFVNSLVPVLLNPEDPLIQSGFRYEPKDIRALNGVLSLPRRARPPSALTGKPEEPNTVPYLAGLALLVFAAERAITYRQKRNG